MNVFIPAEQSAVVILTRIHVFRFMPDTPRLVLHKKQWDNCLIEVADSGDFRSLYFGPHHLQSRMSLSRPHSLTLSYTRSMALALLLQPAPRHILIIGIGGGSFIRFFAHHFPHCTIVAVDCAQQVIDVARGYFQLQESDKVTVFCQDGCLFLQEHCHEQYDLILVDAFNQEGMAATIYSEMFISLCAERLRCEGVLSVNLWSSNEIRYREVKASIKQHFPGSLFLPVVDRGNIVCLAATGPIRWACLVRKTSELERLAAQYEIDFPQLVRVAKQNNLSLMERIRAKFL